MKITTGDIVVESLHAADIVVTSVEVSPKVTIDMSAEPCQTGKE